MPGACEWLAHVLRSARLLQGLDTHVARHYQNLPAPGSPRPNLPQRDKGLDFAEKSNPLFQRYFGRAERI